MLQARTEAHWRASWGVHADLQCAHAVDLEIIGGQVAHLAQRHVHRARNLANVLDEPACDLGIARHVAADEAKLDGGLRAAGERLRSGICRPVVDGEIGKRSRIMARMAPA